MEEQKRHFSKSTERNSSSDVDPLCLFIRRIPNEFSQDDFVDLVTNSGEREITYANLIKKQGYDFSFGFVNFVSQEDASEVLQELNGMPPLNLSVIYANKSRKNESGNRAHSSENVPSFRGRGMHKHSNEFKRQVNKADSACASRGRGQRISLDSPVSRIKIVADIEGRKVTVDPTPDSNGQFADDRNHSRVADPLSKVPNPFYFCFVCGKEGLYSCKICKKPYCSKNCQTVDFANHKEICKKARELSETLLCLYKNFPLPIYDSGVSSNSSSDPEKVDSVIEAKSEVIQKLQGTKSIEKIVLSCGEKELVTVINIESPSKFWVQLKKHYQNFLRMEEELTSHQDDLKHFHNQTCVSPSVVCCTLFKNKVCRAKVLKVKNQNEISVDLLDYGKLVTVQKCALYFLPQEFRNLPAQAIPCRLVSDENEIIPWNDEDTLSFELHTSDKSYKAQIFSFINDAYNVSLINEDGISLYSILIESKKAVSTTLSKAVSTFASETEGKPTSVWSKLKPGSKMFLIPTGTNDTKFWCYLSDGDSYLKELVDIAKLLENYSGEDITITAEEDDFAAGFSNEYKEYYRCRILKRKTKSFLVHYIDYGNKEEITKIKSLSEELLKKCCYLVYCEKPSDLSIEDFNKFLGDSGAEVTVVKVDKNSAKLSFHYNTKYTMICYPCFSDTASEIEETSVNQESLNHSKDGPASTIKKSPCLVRDSRPVEQNTSKVTSPTLNINHISTSRKSLHCEDRIKAVSEKIAVPKTLLSDKNYSVRVVFIKTASELYVQLIEEEGMMNKMVKNLNIFCNSNKSSYIPNIGEIVSCKFKDGVWYRGKVLKKMNEKYLVFFIDYGNEDIVSQDNIQILNEQYILPQFSICVSLSGIKNEDISGLLSKLLSEDWDMKVINPNTNPKEVMLYLKGVPFSEMVETKTNKVKSNLKFQKLSNKSTVKICFEDNQYLYVHQIKDLKSLEQISIKLNNSSDLCCPKHPKVNNVYSGLFIEDGLFYRVAIEEAISCDSFKVSFLDYGNSQTIKTCDLRELPDDLFALPVYCIPLKVQDRKALALNIGEEYSVEVVGIEDNVQLVKFLNLGSPSDLTSENKVNVYENKTNVKDKSSLIYRKLSENEIVDVKVSFMDDKLVYLHQVSDLPCIEDLLIKLNSSLELLPVMQPLVNKVYCGLCSDGCWYRVSVEEVISSSIYKVYFLDYGNYENVSSENLKELKSEFYSVPVYCIPVIVEKRHPNLNLEEQYKIRVLGKQDNLQKVKFIDNLKEDLPNNETKVNAEKALDKIMPEETEKLPHISSLKKQKLPDGLTEVSFCHLEGEIVYCQLLSDSDSVLNIFKILQKYGREGKAPTSVSVGAVICAQASDASWYRACVLCDKKAPLYKVLFFDYGNAESVTGDCIKMLPNELLNLPVFAIPLKIDNPDSITDTTMYTKPMLVRKIKEINGDTYVVELQSEENISYPKISNLKQLTLPDDIISNVSISEKDYSLYYVHPTSNIDNLAKLSNLLLEAATFCKISHSLEKDDIVCAKFDDDNWYRAAVRKVLPDKIEVFFMDYGNSSLVSIENIRVIPVNLCSFPIACIPVKFKDEEILHTRLSKNIMTFDVKVCSVVDNIQVVDIISQYTPTFLSSFTKSSLSSTECCKVIFKMKINELYIAMKLDDCEEMEKLNTLLLESKSDDIQHLPTENEVLLAKKDNLWYRCCILKTSSEGDTFKVYFVDIGITEEIEKSRIQTLPDACKSYKLFAIKMLVESDEPVSLDKCYNISVMNNDSDVYHVKVFHQYKYSSIKRKGLIPMNETDVIFYHKEGEKLFLQSIDNLEILAQIQELLANCSSNSCMPYKPDVGELVCAMSALDNSWYRGCIEEVLSCDKYKVFFIDYGNCEIIQKTKLQPLSLPLTKFPSLSIPVKLADNQVMNGIVLERIYKVIAESAASNNVQIIRIVDKDEVISNVKSESSASSTKCNATKKFLFESCTYVPFNPGEQDIIIYSVDEYNNVYCAPFNEENITANMALTSSITEYCNSKGIPFTDCQLEPGEMVLAFYSVDKSWYRAVIVLNFHPEYQVNFVDYGNSECLNISSLRKMEEKFMELDIQAHMCSLTGFTFPDENLTKVNTELNLFTQPEKNPLKAKVKITDGEITLNVPTITSHLVQKKLVTVVEN